MTQQRRFTKEFREEAVRLVQTSGRTQREIAGDLGIGLSTPVRWIGGAGRGTLSSLRQRSARSRRSCSGCGGRMRSFGRSGTFRRRPPLFSSGREAGLVRAHRWGEDHSPSPAYAACSALAKAAIAPGEVGQPAAANVTTWCCWRMSGQPSICRTAPMTVPGGRGNCRTPAWCWSPPDSSADARQRSAGSAEAAVQADHGQPSRLASRAQPARSGLHSNRAR